MPTATRARRPPARGGRARRRAPRRRWLRTLLWLLLLPGALLVIAGAVTFFYFFVSVPLPSDIGGGPTVLLDATGQEFATLASEFQREDVALADLDLDTVHAVLAAEDADFYEHPGVSVTGILRALWRNVTSGEVSDGGSTITQQYIKVHTADDEQSLIRKIREAALALKLEREYTKDEILAFYLNSVYFGRGAYGIQAAAQAYFGVDAAALTIDQAALLAGVLPAPSSYDPAVNPVAAQVRYDYVLDRMVEESWLDPAAASAFSSVVPATTAGSAAVPDGPAPWFVDLVRRELERELGVGAGSGLTVQTTLNPGVQAHADTAYAEAFPQIARHRRAGRPRSADRRRRRRRGGRGPPRRPGQPRAGGAPAGVDVQAVRAHGVGGGRQLAGEPPGRSGRGHAPWRRRGGGLDRLQLRRRVLRLGHRARGDVEQRQHRLRPDAGAGRARR